MNIYLRIKKKINVDGKRNKRLVSTLFNRNLFMVIQSCNQQFCSQSELCCMSREKTKTDMIFFFTVMADLTVITIIFVLL